MSNYIDTRDLNARKDELESLRDAVTTAEEALQEAHEALNFGADEQAELAELEDLESEISGFRHGETMIPVDSFEAYARELADDIGAIDRDAGWPCNCIDWEQAARELAMDYTTVTYQGEDYLVRS